MSNRETGQDLVPEQADEVEERDEIVRLLLHGPDQNYDLATLLSRSV